MMILNVEIFSKSYRRCYPRQMPHNWLRQMIGPEMCTLAGKDLHDMQYLSEHLCCKYYACTSQSKLKMTWSCRQAELRTCRGKSFFFYTQPLSSDTRVTF